MDVCEVEANLVTAMNSKAARPFKKLKLENNDRTNKIKQSLGDGVKKKFKTRQKLWS